MQIAIATSIIRTDPAESGKSKVDLILGALEQGEFQPVLMARQRMQKRNNYATRLSLEVLNGRKSHSDLVYAIVHNPTFTLISDLIKLGSSRKVITQIGSPGLNRMTDIKGTPFSWRTAYQIIINNLFWLRLYPKVSDVFIVNTRFQKEQLLKVGINEKKLVVLPPLLDRSSFPPQDKQKSIAELQLNSEYRFCTYVGHFTPVKGVEDLIVAFSQLTKDFDDVRLILAWSGYGSKKRIERLIQKCSIREKVIWFGKTDVAKLLSASEILVLPYKSYVGTACPPNLVLEGLSTGTPVVSTSVGCIPEIIHHGETGMIVNPGNPESLKTGMVDVLKDVELSKRMSGAAAKEAERFDKEKNAKFYIDIVDKIIKDEER